MVTVLRNCVLLMGAMFIGFVILTDNMDVLTGAVQKTQTGQSDATYTSSGQDNSADYASTEDNEMVIEAGAWGHFHVDADIGGREIGFLVDTGASLVALSEQDADTIGYPVHQLDYSGRVGTANGTARVAPIMIDEITIGDIVVNNVRGVVIEGHQGSSLLGMTFLRKLAGFEIKNNKLYLRW